MKSLRLIIVLIIAVLFSLVACAKQPQPTQPADKQDVTQPQQSETKQPTVTTQTPTQPPTVTPDPPAQTQKKEITVYVTKTGAKYHSAGCQYLSKSQIPINLSAAQTKGYGPCSKCNPPE